jgi:hypothetical protein
MKLAQLGRACTVSLIFCFEEIGFYNEANTLESNSILIYSELRAGLYTQWIGLDAILIKH